jgi:hypothetical protein
VVAWNVVSGLHVNSHFTFSFDQLLDLTRMATMLVKKVQPQSRTLVEVRQPFGEYYGQNQRSIPPMMYADLLIQGGVQFDGFAAQLYMGQAASGQYTRDIMQLSNLLDQFANWGKPVHLTLGAPSEPVTPMMLPPTDKKKPADADCGRWRRPWSPKWQAQWLHAMYHVALSKPYIDSVAWSSIIDHAKIDLPLSGLVAEDMTPKPSYEKLLAFRRALAQGGQMVIEREAGGDGDAKRDEASENAQMKGSKPEVQGAKPPVRNKSE